MHGGSLLIRRAPGARAPENADAEPDERAGDEKEEYLDCADVIEPLGPGDHEETDAAHEEKRTYGPERFPVHDDSGDC